jgi:hypothetical protein
MLGALALPAAAQVDRYDPPRPYGSPPPYERPYDRPADRMYDSPPPAMHDRPPPGTYERPGTYESMRTAPAERRHGNVTFVTGGVTKDEANSFRAMSSRYMLSLEFAQSAGTFLSNVQVSVTDGRGAPVLQTVSEGPFLLANLPPGQYTVRAASEGRVKTQTVTVASGQNRHVAFIW